MVHTVDVLGILNAFENMQASKALSDDDKKLIARELLANIPEDIMAPGCRNTSNAVRAVIRKYLGVDSGRTKEPKAESPVIVEPDAAASAEKFEAQRVVVKSGVAESSHRANVKAPRGRTSGRNS